MPNPPLLRVNFCFTIVNADCDLSTITNGKGDGDLLYTATVDLFGLSIKELVFRCRG